MQVGKTPNRISLERFLEAHRFAGRTLEVGAQPLQYRGLFPGSVVIDIRSGPAVDACCDVQSLPFASAAFDMVVCAEVLEHVRNPEAALREMRRVLAPSGRLLLTTRFVYPFHEEPHDYWRFTDHALRRLLERTGWQVEVLEPDTSDGGTLLLLVHYWLFARSGLAWMLPKLVWLPIWSAGSRWTGRGGRTRGRFPSGWHVLATVASSAFDAQTVGASDL